MSVKYKVIKDAVVDGVQLSTADQDLLKEMFESGDHRFIEKVKTKSKKKNAGESGTETETEGEQ